MIEELLKHSDDIYHLFTVVAAVFGAFGFMTRWLKQHLVSSLSDTFASKEQVDRIEKKIDILHTGLTAKDGEFEVSDKGALRTFVYRN